MPRNRLAFLLPSLLLTLFALACDGGGDTRRPDSADSAVTNASDVTVLNNIITNNAPEDALNWTFGPDSALGLGITADSAGRLTALNIYSRSLSGGLDMSGAEDLTKLYASNNTLTAFKQSGLTNLQVLYLFNNQLSAVDLSGLTNLRQLYLFANQLSAVDLSGLTNLQSVDLQANQLSDIDLKGLANLRELYLYDNQLSSIDLSGLANLRTLDLYSNRLSLSILNTQISLARQASPGIKLYYSDQFNVYFTYLAAAAKPNARLFAIPAADLTINGKASEVIPYDVAKGKLSNPADLHCENGVCSTNGTPGDYGIKISNTIADDRFTTTRTSTGLIGVLPNIPETFIAPLEGLTPQGQAAADALARQYAKHLNNGRIVMALDTPQGLPLAGLYNLALANKKDNPAFYEGLEKLWKQYDQSQLPPLFQGMALDP